MRAPLSFAGGDVRWYSCCQEGGSVSTEWEKGQWGCGTRDWTGAAGASSPTAWPRDFRKGTRYTGGRLTGPANGPLSVRGIEVASRLPLSVYRVLGQGNYENKSWGNLELYFSQVTFERLCHTVVTPAASFRETQFGKVFFPLETTFPCLPLQYGHGS